MNWTTVAAYFGGQLTISVLDATGAPAPIRDVAIHIGRPTTAAEQLDITSASNAKGWSLNVVLATGPWRLDLSGVSASGRPVSPTPDGKGGEMSVAACPGCALVTGAESGGRQRFDQAEVRENKLFAFLCRTFIALDASQRLSVQCLWFQAVISARVNLSQRRLTAVTGPELTETDLIAALASIGRNAQAPYSDLLATESDAAGRDLLAALGVAGFAMMNVMLLSVSVWSGAEASTREFLHWVSAAIALPAVAFSARPFFRAGLRALRSGQLNMDVPIAVAIALAAGMSLYETAYGGQHAYFDAALSLTFFLLLGRYLDHRTRLAARSAAERAFQRWRRLRRYG